MKCEPMRVGGMSGEAEMATRTEEKAVTVALPQKKFYRQRAHSNPMSDHDLDYPVCPSEWDAGALYELKTGEEKKEVEFLDVGCGYGGLLVSLSSLYPDHLSLGLEIRMKVSDYVMERIRALRAKHPGQYGNIACLRANAMKYLPNFFNKGQLSKMFFLYPDPHFKKGKHKWRIINTSLIAEYAYVLRITGRLYTITDVEDLHVWMRTHLSRHPLFRQLSSQELEGDPVVPLLSESTEEGQKVTRNEGQKFLAVFTRVSDSFDSL